MRQAQQTMARINTQFENIYTSRLQQ